MLKKYLDNFIEGAKSQEYLFLNLNDNKLFVTWTIYSLWSPEVLFSQFMLSWFN